MGLITAAAAVLLWVRLRAPSPDPSQVQTRVSLERVDLALKAYQKDCGSFPSQALGLSALRLKSGCKNRKGPFLEDSQLRDGWGRELGYRFDDSHPEVYSLGADGLEGGTELNQDLSRTIGETHP